MGMNGPREPGEDAIVRDLPAQREITAGRTCKSAAGGRDKVSDVSAATGETTDIAGERRVRATGPQRFMSLPHHRFEVPCFFIRKVGGIHCAIV
jgi:hypothetical protein